MNIGYFGLLGPTSLGTPELSPAGICDKTPRFYCETILVAFTNPPLDGVVQSRRRIDVTLDEFGPVAHPVADFDLVAHDSNAEGERLSELSGSTTAGATEHARFDLRTTVADPTAWVLLTVVYYTSVESGYRGSLRG